MHLRRIAVTAAVLILGAAAGGGSVPETASAGQMEVGEDRPVTTASKDTLGPTIEEARQMIVGTWIEDVASEIGSHKKGPKRWVFTESGTVRKYRDGELFAEQSYEVVRQYDKMQDPSEVDGYLKFTQANGEAYYATIQTIRRGDNPVLLVMHHGVSPTSTIFMPPHAFN